MNEREARLVLNAAVGLSPARQNALLAAGGGALCLFSDAPAPDGLLPEEQRRLGEAAERCAREGLAARLASEGVSLVLREDPEYPPGFLDAEDPPHLLYVRGKLPPTATPAMAIIGTRHPSLYGLQQAQRFATGLAAAGFVIVSGAARGIDAAAMEACLKSGASAVGILGTGIDRVYPQENGELFVLAARAGALVSEFPPGTAPLRGNFPWRNRLISAFGLGIFVVEAGLKSGSLATARWALDQGRDVFALPGQVGKESTRGCHRLIKDGAQLAEDPEDVIEFYRDIFEIKAASTPGVGTQNGELAPAAPGEATAGLPAIPGLDGTPRSFDALAELSGLEPGELSARLMKAVAAGAASKLPGGYYALGKA